MPVENPAIRVCSHFMFSTRMQFSLAGHQGGGCSIPGGAPAHGFTGLVTALGTGSPHGFGDCTGNRMTCRAEYSTGLESPHRAGGGTEQCHLMGQWVALGTGSPHG